MDRPQREASLQQLEALAQWMDDRWQIPGTSVRFGLDAVLGLLPGIGDSLTGLLSLWIVHQARQHGAPWHVQTRMVGNIGIDWLVGIIPLVGDLFDMQWRANRRNLNLLRRHLAEKAAART